MNVVDPKQGGPRVASNPANPTAYRNWEICPACDNPILTGEATVVFGHGEGGRIHLECSTEEQP